MKRPREEGGSEDGVVEGSELVDGPATALPDDLQPAAKRRRPDTAAARADGPATEPDGADDAASDGLTARVGARDATSGADGEHSAAIDGNEDNESVSERRATSSSAAATDHGSPAREGGGSGANVTAGGASAARGDEPFRPGNALDLPEVADVARLIAQAFGADLTWTDADAKKKAASLAERRLELEERVFTARRGVMDDPSDKAAKTALRHAEKELDNHDRTAAHVREGGDAKYRRNMREQVLRVTLQKDVSTINQRAAEAEGDAPLLVQAPVLRCITCGNADETAFLADTKQGDTVCTR
jgi:hypothetical protein